MTTNLTRVTERHRLAKSRYIGKPAFGQRAIRALWWANTWWKLANKLKGYGYEQHRRGPGIPQGGG